VSESTRGPKSPGQAPQSDGPPADRPRESDLAAAQPLPSRSGPAKAGRSQSTSSRGSSAVAEAQRDGQTAATAERGPVAGVQAKETQDKEAQAKTQVKDGQAKDSKGATQAKDGKPEGKTSERETDTAVQPAVSGAAGSSAMGSSATQSGDQSAAEQMLTPAKHKPGQPRRTRKARLRLSRLDPWSVMKTSFLFSIAAGIMLVVAVYVVWTVIGASSLFESVNDIVKSVVSTPGDTTPFRIQEYINTQKVMGVTALLACVDVVIFTALATLGSFLYNLAATMLGGLEVTLAED
jgi:hypothetical protein